MKIESLENALSAKELKDYFLITIAMFFYRIGWTVFLLPNSITTGSVPGISSVLCWELEIPVQYSYFFISAVLIVFALHLLGLRFCIKTIFGIIILTTLTSLAQIYMLDVRLLSDQPFMANVIGAAFCEAGVGLGLSANGNTDDTDIVATIVNRYRDIPLGRVILIYDLVIISFSYLALHDWEKVIYDYVVLFITSLCADQVVDPIRRLAQLFIISSRYEGVGRQINENPHRGCTVINASGFYSSHEVRMLFVLAKKSESGKIFDLINDIDPTAFVSQSAVIGVYSESFDRFEVRQKKNSPNKLFQREQGNSNPQNREERLISAFSWVFVGPSRY